MKRIPKPYTKRQRAILKVYEMACTALKWRRDRGEITDEDYIKGCKQLLHAYHLDLGNEESIV